MRKIVALVVAVLVGAPTGALAQGFAETNNTHGPLLTAVFAEAVREGALWLHSRRHRQIPDPAGSPKP